MTKERRPGPASLRGAKATKQSSGLSRKTRGHGASHLCPPYPLPATRSASVSKPECVIARSESDEAIQLCEAALDCSASVGWAARSEAHADFQGQRVGMALRAFATPPILLRRANRCASLRGAPATKQSSFCEAAAAATPMRADRRRAKSPKFTSP